MIFSRPHELRAFFWAVLSAPREMSVAMNWRVRDGLMDLARAMETAPEPVPSSPIVLESGCSLKELHGLFHQQFRFRPGNQYLRVDFKIQRPEFLLTYQISDRFMSGPVEGLFLEKSSHSFHPEIDWKWTINPRRSRPKTDPSSHSALRRGSGRPSACRMASAQVRAC